MKNITPHITEKSYQGISEDKKVASTYTFLVDGSLDKTFIKKQIEKQFSVTVEDVRTVNLPGKVRRFKSIVGKTVPRSKAIVRLKKGDRIAAFDIEDKDKKTEDNQ